MDVFYALAEPRRRKIVELLAREGQMSATNIYGKFDVTAQAISQHLRVLREAKLVKMEKQAQRHIYQVNPDSILEVERWARDTERLWVDRFDRLDEVFKTEKHNAKR
ncbi:MAG: metalloregulator ArsR/SmtB family transcription factor [Candidatus Marsarchaeota archaeon]|nr:metalloregulator ArsR/SmtB family transcription factor [Candidatus Marsarchaeota archaeon]